MPSAAAMTWNYRSHGSVKSTASSHPSISLCLPNNSGESAVTIDGFDDGDEKLSRWVKQYVNLHPYNDHDEEKMSPPQAEVAASPSPPCQIDSTNTTDDPTELMIWTENFKREHPIDGVAAETVAQEELEVKVAQHVDCAAELASDPMLNAMLMASWETFSQQAPQNWMIDVQPVIVPYPVLVPVPSAHNQAAASSLFSSPMNHSDFTPHPRRRDRSRSQASRRPRFLTTEEEESAQMDDAALWERRIKKRLEGLDNLKNSDCYKNNQDISKSQRPTSPDPYDRTASKRAWEKGIAECRGEWRRINGVRQLVGMGFEEPRAERAWLEASQQEPGAEETKIMKQAIWLLRLQELLAMGFGKRRATVALKKAKEDIHAAVDILVQGAQ